MMKVESYITATSEIARVFRMTRMYNNHNIVYSDSSTKPLKYDINKRHPTIDEILTNGGFTLRYDTYAPPSEFATLEGEIKAHLSPNERDAQAYNSRTKKSCNTIESAIIGYLKEVDLAFRSVKGEKIEGVIGEFKAIGSCALKFTTPKGYWVDESVLENYFGFAEFFNSLCDDYQLQGSLMTDSEVRQKSELSKPQAETKPESREPQLPAELDSDSAKEIFAKAVEVGLMEVQGNGYKWNKSKALLAYFADKMSEHLNLGKGIYDGKKKTSWKPFENMLNIKGLSGAKRDYQRDGTLPDGSNIVDTLF